MTSQTTLSNEVNETFKDEAFDVAPNWKLVWWRFKKHRLALVSAFVLLGIILIALFPDFFSIQDPNKSSARKSFMPPQGISFFHDGGFQVHVKPLKGKRNKTTLKMEWGVDEKRILPLRFFTSGYEYEVFGLFKTDLHLFGIEKPSARNSFHLLGTDRLGRDQWSRLMHGPRVSLSIGLVAVGLSIFLGILLGGISGYYGGWPDLVIQRLIEILQSLPPIPIWMA
ncbi:MAG: ABC transporter permease, partial [SAR324 cluster bacterium]|nr:ABC transporter permease [SAR324 cluster bacterium]